MTADEQRAWRKAPANTHQLAALRKLAMASGRTFNVGIRQGDAWSRISRATRFLSIEIRKRCAPPWIEVAE